MLTSTCGADDVEISRTKKQTQKNAKVVPFIYSSALSEMEFYLHHTCERVKTKWSEGAIDLLDITYHQRQKQALSCWLESALHESTVIKRHAM
jgi:hypothetical protein